MNRYLALKMAIRSGYYVSRSVNLNFTDNFFMTDLFKT